MSFDIGVRYKTRKNDSILEVTLLREFTVEELIEKVITEFLQRARQEHLSKVLFDLSSLIDPVPTVLDRFKLAEAFVRLQRELKVMVKCAVVGKEPVIDPKRFGETVAVNRGALLKVFTDREEAEIWLKQDPHGE